MPGPMETSPGSAPEVTVHKEAAFTSEDDLSPEEQAVQGASVRSTVTADAAEETEAAALTEGRLAPPVSRTEKGK